MENDLVLFSYEQGNFLIRILLAHIIADFVLQPTKVVENKKTFSLPMLWHIAVVAILAFLFTFSWKITLVISLTHWLIDSYKKQIENKLESKYLVFALDQLAHLFIIFLIWSYKYQLTNKWIEFISILFTNYKISLILFAYSIVIWPIGYILRFALQDIAPQKNNIQNGNYGRQIGQFERIIILTFVLLNQYEAIGFLITGKSIIRLAKKNEDIKSEYVLLGTMMSYGLSIIIGVIVNWLLAK